MSGSDAWLRTYWVSRVLAQPGPGLVAVPAARLAAAGAGAGQPAAALAQEPVRQGRRLFADTVAQPGGGLPPAGWPACPAGPSRAFSGNVALGAAALLCAMAIMFVPRSAFGTVFQPGFFDLATPRIRAEKAAVAAVPPGVMVATANKIGPHLVARDTVILWDGAGSTPLLLAPWVIACTSQVQFTFSTISQEQTGRDGVAFLERRGYKVVFDRLGYYVLHRGDFPARHGKS